MENEQDGIPSVEPTVETPSGGEDYHTRIRSEGEFAVGEVQKKDSYIGELHTKLKGYEGLDEYVSAAGGADKLIELAIEGNLARQTATAAPETPAVPSVNDDELDTIYDPEVKMIDGKYKEIIDAQNSRIAQMEQQLTNTTMTAVKGGLMENIGEALSDFSSSPDLEAKAKEVIMGAVETSERLAKSGNKSAADNLEQLATPAGIKALRMMTADIYREMALAGNVSPDNGSNGEAKSLSTDTPSNARSSIGSDTVTVAPGTRVTSNTVREVMEALAEKRGKSPSTLFG